MSFDRPRTPPRSGISFGSIDGETRKSNTSRPLQPNSGYTPTVFDLVYPARDAVSLVKQYIPPVFLEAEAVDSSVLLGNGASFTASMQTIPQGPKNIEITTDMDGWSVTKCYPAPPRPSHVVYKTARVAFDKKGEPLPDYRRALQSVLTEFHALISPSLFNHPNVIDFLGMAWGSNPFSPEHKLPALIVEYAEHGTLTQLLQRKPGPDFDLKHILCLDVARGLLALHTCGLIHGGVKTENVLICKSPNRQHVAKISDFGFSVIAATELAEIWIGGTDPWRAPEIGDGPVRRDAAKYTDTYSYGLMVWSVCLDGSSPFDFASDNLMGSSEIDELKKSDRMLAIAKSNEWCRRYAQVIGGSKLEEAFDAAVEKTANASSKEARQQMMRLFSRVRDKALKKLVTDFSNNKLVRSLQPIFEVSLRIIPESRDLGLIIEVLEADIKELQKRAQQQGNGPAVAHEPEHIPTDQDINYTGMVEVQDLTTWPEPRSQNIVNEDRSFWELRGYKHHWLSWQKTRELQPSVQNFVMRSFDGSKASKDGPKLFVLCAYYLNGYGCRPNVDEALNKLQQAVDVGNHPACAFQHRMWAACRPEQENPGRQHLEDYAKAGSRPALEELRKVAPGEDVEKLYRWITDASGGVGADWLSEPYMLHGYTQSQWINDEWLLERVNEAKVPLSQLLVNKRGDTLLHFTAMCGRWKPFQALVVNHKMNINLQNPLGETALLCSCRSGLGGIVIKCLKQYNADASIAAQNGETPMHWLIHFDDAYIEPMLKDLVARGAVVNALTKERISHSRYPGHVDVDVKLPGTPLTWAVHENRAHIVGMLLEFGADPNLVPSGAASNALHYAAYYHHHECLKAIIEHLESLVTSRTSDGELDLRWTTLYGPVVQHAEQGADKFSMVLRGGTDYLVRLHATLDFLREKTKLIEFQGQLEGSLLYTAVSHAHDDVVDYMFQHQWIVSTINTPIGDAHRTPLLEAVRWNRLNLVQTLLDQGGDINALAANPFSPKERNWSALHIFAHEGHDDDVALVSQLVNLGLHVDGQVITKALTTSEDQEDASSVNTGISTLTLGQSHIPEHEVESPFAVAVRHNAFSLAKELLALGADPNHTSSKSGLFASEYPLTPLGHVIISNARYSLARLSYLLYLESKPVSFVVEPLRNLTALHRCAMAHWRIKKRTGEDVPKAEFDKDTNADIMYELLRGWRRQDELDAVCRIGGNTALHLAIKVENTTAARALLEAGASAQIRNAHNETAVQLAEKLKDRSPESRRMSNLVFSFMASK